MEKNRLIQGNEEIGYYRSISQHKKALEISEEMLVLIEQSGLSGTEEHGTTLLNAATAYRAAGYCEKSISMYKEAEKIYHLLGITDIRMAGLYNNMSMAYQELKIYEKAVSCLEQALLIVGDMENVEVELATTHTNLASVYYEMGQPTQGILHIEQAVQLFRQAEGADGIDAHYSGALALLAQGYYLQGDLKRAIDTYTAALKEILTHFGKNEAYALTCENCAVVLEKSGFLKEAEYLKQEAENVYERVRRPVSRIPGLELSRKYYEAYGKRMIQEQFPEYQNRAAAGLVGHGSECLGFDDESSEDHDYGPAFCIWLTEEDYEKIGAKMQEAYDALPKTFMGYPARKISDHGKNRVGVLTINGFYEEFIGDGDWTKMEDESLAMAVNGEVFTDPLGTFSAIRERLKTQMPYEIWKRKVANAAALMAQSGQYNYPRCVKRGDMVAASMALNEFVKEGMRMVYLLNRKYMPYYKWAWRGIGNLRQLSELQPLFAKVFSDAESREKEAVIESICKSIVDALRQEKMTYGEEPFLEWHVQNILKARENMNPIIEEIVKIEWEMFQNVRNTGGRASCQDDFETFDIMRKSQFLTWDLPLLERYKKDLEMGSQKGRNLVMEKYAYMMESTAPEEYAQIEEGLPKITEEKAALIEQIVGIQVSWREDFAKVYPGLSGQARIIHTSEDTLQDISFETYLRGELKTYSMETVVLYGRRVVEFVKEGKNMTEEIMKYTTRFYGYETIEEAEKKA